MLPPLTHESRSSLSSRFSAFRRRSTPRWNAAALKPPPDSASPMRFSTPSILNDMTASSLQRHRMLVLSQRNAISHPGEAKGPSTIDGVLSADLKSAAQGLSTQALVELSV